MRKKIDLETISIRNDYTIDNFLKGGGIEMEFIDIGRGKFLVRNSNGLVVNEKERLKMEKEGLIIKDITSDTCQEKTTKRIRSINKKLEEVEANDTIEETNTTI
jgi:hypothetical protein